MRGRSLFFLFLAFLILFSAGLFYAINYRHYEFLEHDHYTLESDGGPIELANVKMLTGSTSPLKFRICADEAELEQFEIAPAPTPLIAPFWFDCFDGKMLGNALERGDAVAYIIEQDAKAGVDIYAMNYQGGSYFWRQINECGEAKFSGEAAPPECGLDPEGDQ